MMRKNTFINLFIFLSLALLLTSCSSPEIFAITKDGTFSGLQCKTHNPDYDIVMFESKYCSYCQETLPIFKEAVEKRGFTPVILDLAQTENLKRMQEEYGVSIQYTPTFLFGCDYVVGAKTLADYEQLLNTYEEFRDAYT